VSVGTRNLQREFSKSLKAQRAPFNYSLAHSRSLDVVPAGLADTARERQRKGKSNNMTREG